MSNGVKIFRLSSHLFQISVRKSNELRKSCLRESADFLLPKDAVNAALSLV